MTFRLGKGKSDPPNQRNDNQLALFKTAPSVYNFYASDEI